MFKRSGKQRCLVDRKLYFSVNWWKVFPNQGSEFGILEIQTINPEPILKISLK